MAGVCRVLGLKEASLLGMATEDAHWHPTVLRVCAHSLRMRGQSVGCGLRVSGWRTTVVKGGVSAVSVIRKGAIEWAEHPRH